MKRNRWKAAAAAGVLIGCLAIGGIGTVALAGGNAYKNLKNAVFQTAKIENMTMNNTIAVTIDDKLIAEGEITAQTDGINSYTYSKINVGESTQEFETNHNEEGTILRRGDEYTSIPSSYRSYDRLEEESYNYEKSEKLIELVTDTLLGSTKNQFTGDKDNISVTLEGAQIPELLQLAVSAMMEQSNSDREYSELREYDMEEIQLPFNFMNDVQIKRISFTASLNDGYISKSDMTVVLAGKDDNNKAHTGELSVKTDIQNINNTTVNAIDTTGKEVKELNEEEFNYRMR